MMAPGEKSGDDQHGMTACTEVIGNQSHSLFMSDIEIFQCGPKVVDWLTTTTQQRNNATMQCDISRDFPGFLF